MLLDTNIETTDIEPMFSYVRDEQGYIAICVKDKPCSKCIFFVGCLCREEEI